MVADFHKVLQTNKKFHAQNEIIQIEKLFSSYYIQCPASSIFAFAFKIHFLIENILYL